jgi:hypothetical protein
MKPQSSQRGRAATQKITPLPSPSRGRERVGGKFLTKFKETEHLVVQKTQG